MPRLPGPESLPRARLTRDPGLQVPNLGGDVAEAVSDFGSLVSGLTIQLVEADSARQLTTATAGAAKELNDLAFEFEADTEFETQGERFKEAAAKIRAKHADSIRSQSTRGVFDRDFGTLRQSKGIAIARRAREGMHDRAIAGLDIGLFDLSQQIPLSSSKAERNVLIGQGRISIADLVNKGMITAQDGVARDQNFRSQIDEDDVRRMILEDPEAAEVALLGNQKFSNLTEDKRLTLLARAQSAAEGVQRERIKAVEKAEAVAEKEIKEAQDVRAAELTDDILEGNGSDAVLDAALANGGIRGPQFIAARKLLKAQDQPSALQDDPSIVLAMTEALADGILTKDEVMGNFANKLIKQSTMNKYIDDIDNDPDDFRTSEQKTRLRQNVSPRSGPFAVLDNDDTRKVNDAIERFERRTRGPNAEDPVAVRKDIEEQFTEPRSLESLPRPRHMVGGDKENLEFEATMRATLKAFREGGMTPQQFADEIELINDIARINREGR